MLEDPEFDSHRGRMLPGDALLFYTDGLVETPDRDLSIGIDRLLGMAERLVTGGFESGARTLMSAVPDTESDDRACVLIWRAEPPVARTVPRADPPDHARQTGAMTSAGSGCARHARSRDPEVVLTRAEVTELLERAPRPLAVDPAYEDRTGFDVDFLAVPVPLPVLDPDIAEDAAIPTGAGDDPVLRYHHFSVVLSRSRRLARWTAVNLDGRRRYVVDRSGDSWVLDPRLPAGAQVGEALYADNDLDRGHLVRRQDPVWGDTLEEALAANDDTFHFTNCAPQQPTSTRARRRGSGSRTTS